jgi:hypothetical protein
MPQPRGRSCAAHLAVPTELTAQAAWRHISQPTWSPARHAVHLSSKMKVHGSHLPPCVYESTMQITRAMLMAMCIKTGLPASRNVTCAGTFKHRDSSPVKECHLICDVVSSWLSSGSQVKTGKANDSPVDSRPADLIARKSANDRCSTEEVLRAQFAEADAIMTTVRIPGSHSTGIAGGTMHGSMGASRSGSVCNERDVNCERCAARWFLLAHESALVCEEGDPDTDPVLSTSQEFPAEPHSCDRYTIPAAGMLRAGCQLHGRSAYRGNCGDPLKHPREQRNPAAHDRTVIRQGHSEATLSASPAGQRYQSPGCRLGNSASSRASESSPLHSGAGNAYIRTRRSESFTAASGQSSKTTTARRDGSFATHPCSTVAAPRCPCGHAGCVDTKLKVDASDRARAALAAGKAALAASIRRRRQRALQSV